MSKCYAENIIKLALEEVGYCEKKTNSQLYDKTANAGAANWNKYADYIDKNYPDFYNTKKNGYDWCDIFVDYLFIKCFGLSNALKLTCQPLKSCGAGCYWSALYYQNKKQFGKKPRIGSQIFFGRLHDDCYHTGLVYDYDNTYVYTVEGNSSEKVAKRKYKINDPDIYGYGYPDYDEKSENTAEKNSQNTTSNNEGVEILARECVRGLWGNGTERAERLYNAIQARVNEYMKNPKSAAHKNKGVELLALDVIRGKYGSGQARAKNIYNAIQDRVNELCRG